jgi:hypothetical protein
MTGKEEKQNFSRTIGNYTLGWIFLIPRRYSASRFFLPPSAGMLDRIGLSIVPLSRV